MTPLEKVLEITRRMSRRDRAQLLVEIFKDQGLDVPQWVLEDAAENTTKELETDHWIDKIPPLLKSGLIRYRDNGLPTGDFLQAVLSNDLIMTILRADPDSIKALPEILWWLKRFMPSEAWGSPQAYADWIRGDGTQGYEITKYQSWTRKREAELDELGRETEL